MTNGFKSKAIAALPKTADGYPIFPGMVVYVLGTGDAGKTWAVTHECKVSAVQRLGVRLEKQEFWNMTGIGDNRLFRSAAAAKREGVRRKLEMQMLFTGSKSAGKHGR